MCKKYAILLTACVNPKGMSYTYLQDVNIRMRQYLEAVDFYLKNTAFPIIFCENTLCDFSDRYSSAISSGRLEYLTFDGNNFDRLKGKGYGEVEIMEYAYAHSAFLKDVDVVVKITGRLIVSNILAIIKINQLMVYPVIQTLFTNGKVMDSRMILAPYTFFEKYFFPRKNLINDSCQIYFEHVLYDAVVNQNQYFYFPYLIVPLFRGQSGTNGSYYKADFTFRDQLIYMYYSLGHSIRFSRNHAKKKFSIVVIGLIQLVRIFIKIVINVCSILIK